MTRITNRSTQIASTLIHPKLLGTFPETLMPAPGSRGLIVGVEADTTGMSCTLPVLPSALDDWDGSLDVQHGTRKAKDLACQRHQPVPAAVAICLVSSILAGRASKEISYTDFLAEVRAGHVKEGPNYR